MDPSRWNVSPRAAALHADALVLHNHTCLPLRPDVSCLPYLHRFREAGAGTLGETPLRAARQAGK